MRGRRRASGAGRTVLGLAMLLPSAITAQASSMGGAALYEDYSFGDGHVLSSLSQFTTPVALSSQLGERLRLNLSTGHVYVLLRSRDVDQVPDQSFRGPLDTDFRLELDASQRVLVFVSGTLPTGRETVVEDRLSLLSAIANDAIGFSSPSLGAGGRVSMGGSTAVPVGRMALGLAVMGQYSFGFTPVAGEGAHLRPGAELRLRLGLEGALASRTYLRFSGSAIGQQKDRLGDATAHGVGHRFVGFVSVEQGLGGALLSLYAFDVYRASPQLEATALGTAALPKGNLLSAGLTVAVPLGAATTLTALGDYRVSAAATGEGGTEMLRQGTVMRAEGGVRQAFGDRFALSLTGGIATGDLRQAVDYFAVDGYRVSLRLQVTP